MESTKLTARRVEVFLTRLSELASALPSAERKEEIDRDLDIIVEFLLDFKKRLHSVPAFEDMQGLEESIKTLQHFVRVAEGDVVLSKALGLKQAGKPRSRTHSGSDLANVNVEKEVERIKSLSPEEIKLQLSDKTKYGAATLRSISAELGIRVGSNVSRELIIEKIVKRIGNLAGYDYLRTHA